MKEHERYIIDEREVELLDKYEGIINKTKDPERYGGFAKETLESFCRMKDKSNDMYVRRYQGACEVIDLVADAVGIEPGNSGFWLYAPDADGKTPIVDRINEWISRSGDKAKLKKRVEELERENELLRSLFTEK